jgi:hypothetical protein
VRIERGRRGIPKGICVVVGREGWILLKQVGCRCCKSGEGGREMLTRDSAEQMMRGYLGYLELNEAEGQR